MSSGVTLTPSMSRQKQKGRNRRRRPHQTHLPTRRDTSRCRLCRENEIPRGGPLRPENRHDAVVPERVEVLGRRRVLCIIHNRERAERVMASYITHVLDGEGEIHRGV